MKSFYSAFCIIACLTITACSKDKTNNTDIVKKLTGADSGKTTAVTQGQTLTVTLGNPGDGGYQFDDPKFSASVLKLVEHTHQAGNANMIGDFGTDTWKFTAGKTGTTTLEITASRSFDANSDVAMFSGKVTVK